MIQADARALPVRDAVVDCVVTSPPYWGLRDYGARDQLGLEPTPGAYVDAIRAVFAEVWRVLKPTGTVWANLGDSYAAHHTNQDTGRSLSITDKQHRRMNGERIAGDEFGNLRRLIPEELKVKDLIGIPWRVAFALQADGWYLRSDIIWAKPNPMPESVTDRPTKAHEYLFLLAKSERYYYDAAAISEPLAVLAHSPGQHKIDASRNDHDRNSRIWGLNGQRNKRSVWTVPTMPYAGAHFATMPEALVEPCILAGCPLGGLVLDPFLGSGTVGAVAERLGRRWIGTDLAYHDLARERTAQRGFRWDVTPEVAV